MKAHFDFHTAIQSDTTGLPNRSRRSHSTHPIVVKIKLSLPYVIAFLALTILCGTSHEFVHHFVGAAFCGCFGYKTFNSFTLCSSCAGQPLGVHRGDVGRPAFHLRIDVARHLGPASRLPSVKGQTIRADAKHRVIELRSR
jgi:hypothetical protein